MKLILIFILLFILFGMLYFRNAPHNVETVHQAPKPGPMGDTYLNGGFIHRRAVSSAEAGPLVQRLDGIIRKTPRTSILAGSIGDGCVTYVTYSFLWGFPDYTTVSLTQDAGSGGETEATLTVYGRLRFGKSDLQINKKRIQGWLKELDA